MLYKNTIEELIDYALYRGCSFVEFFLENNKKTTNNFSNGNATESTMINSSGVGIRLFFKSRFHYISTNDLSKKNLFTMIKDITSGNDLKSFVTCHKFLAESCYNTLQDCSTLNLQREEINTNLIELTQRIKLAYPLVTDAFGTNFGESQNVLIANSNGVYIHDTRTRIRLIFDVYASNRTKQHNLSFSCGETLNERLFQHINFESECFDVAETAIKFLNATNVPSGRMPVVIDNGIGAIMFHEACGHGLEASSIVNNTSVFSQKMDTVVSSELITMVDDGAFQNAWGTATFDDEGNETKENILIENGILKSYLLDNTTSNKLGMKNTHSCRRESYKYPPSPRMSNTYIKNGTTSRDDIISSVDYGILIKGVSGGAANPSTGDFEFTSNEGYLIEKGQISRPLKTVNISGNGCDILKKIELIGNNLKFSEGYCGSISGTVPITVGQPTIKISELNVGGIS